MSLSPTKILLPRFLVCHLFPNHINVAVSLLLITLMPLMSMDGISKDPKSRNQPVSEAAQSGHCVTSPTPPLQIKVSTKDGFVTLKAKNKDVEQAEECVLSTQKRGTRAREAERGGTERKMLSVSLEPFIKNSYFCLISEQTHSSPLSPPGAEAQKIKYHDKTQSDFLEFPFTGQAGTHQKSNRIVTSDSAWLKTFSSSCLYMQVISSCRPRG